MFEFFEDFPDGVEIGYFVEKSPPISLVSSGNSSNKGSMVKATVTSITLNENAVSN